MFISDLPIINSPISIHHENGKAILTWGKPEGFFTGLGIEACSYTVECQMHTIPNGTTRFELEGKYESYRLVVFQHGERVAESKTITNTRLWSKGTIHFRHLFS